jgi:hypothetical protein
VRSDEAYVYLRLDVGKIDWRRANYLIGIDTYRADLGDTQFPYTSSRSSVGFEFMLELRGPDAARLLVDKPYNLYRMIGGVRWFNRPFRTLRNADGHYDSLLVVTNRRRIGRNGTVYPAYQYDRNLLRYAPQLETTLADWYADTLTGVIEIRLGWGMLHVLDPSSRSVLYGDAESGEVAGDSTDGFRFVVQSFNPQDPLNGGERLPYADTEIETWSWRAWEEPRWHADVKPVFATMQAVFAALGDTRAPPPVSNSQSRYRSGTRPPKLNEPKR